MSREQINDVPLLLIPGLMCDGRAFWHQLGAVSARRPVQIASPGPADSIAALADRVLAQAPPQFVLAGHGLGAVIAVEIAGRFPERVESMILMDIDPLPERPQAAASREARMVWARSGRLVDAVLAEFPETAFAPDSPMREVQAQILEMAEAQGGETYLAQARAWMRRPDSQRMLRLLRIPTLLFCGAYDTICPPRRHGFLADMMPDARLVMIEEAGHLPMLERPEEVTGHILRWLSETGPNPGRKAGA